MARKQWRLAARLRIAILGLPLALGAGCEKKPRGEEPRALVIDAALAAPEPEPDPLDAAVATMEADASSLPLPAVFVRGPNLRLCSEGNWCAPAEQAQKNATRSAKLVDGCASELGFSRSGRRFALNLLRSRTQKQRAAGKDLCCYEWDFNCPKPGRALTERGRGRRANPRRGSSWSASAASG